MHGHLFHCSLRIGRVISILSVSAMVTPAVATDGWQHAYWKQNKTLEARKKSLSRRHARIATIGHNANFQQLASSVAEHVRAHGYDSVIDFSSFGILEAKGYRVTEDETLLGQTTPHGKEALQNVGYSTSPVPTKRSSFFNRRPIPMWGTEGMLERIEKLVVHANKTGKPVLVMFNGHFPLLAFPGDREMAVLDRMDVMNKQGTAAANAAQDQHWKTISERAKRIWASSPSHDSP